MDENRLLRLIWRFAFRFVGRVIPMTMIRFGGKALGSILFYCGIRRSVAVQNIRLAFPQKTDSEVRALARKAMESLAVVYLEIPKLRYLSDARLRSELSVENLDVIRSIDNRGALLLSAHIGNWELLALSTSFQAQRSFAIVVKDQKDFGELEQTRTVHGNTTIPLHRSALQVSRTLASGGVVAMLADQSAPEREPLVQLFGVPTRAYTAPAKLALRYRPRVVLGFAVRRKGGTYCARLQELHYDDLEDTPEGIVTFTQRYVTMLEDVVRNYPEQWVWGHRRWKNSPGVRYD